MPLDDEKEEKKPVPQKVDFVPLVPGVSVAKIGEIAEKNELAGQSSQRQKAAFRRDFAVFCRKENIGQLVTPAAFARFIASFVNVDRDWLDALAECVAVAFFGQFSDKKGTSSQYAALLSAAIRYQLKLTASFMFHQCMGIHGETGAPDSGDLYTPLFYAIQFDDMRLFVRLLEVTEEVNHASHSGKTALYLAFLHKRPAMWQLLLEHAEIDLHDRNYYSFYQEIRFQAACFRAVARRLSSVVVEINWEEPLNIPVTFLNTMCQQQLQAELIDKVQQLPLFIDNEALRETFLAFIANTVPLSLQRLNRLAIALECVQILCHPEWVDQQNTNLCGPAAVMQYLALIKPAHFVYATLEMAELPGHRPHLPAKIRRHPACVRDTSYTLTSLWLETLRASYNPVLGYHANSTIELLQGMTSPRIQIDMLRDFGFVITADTMQVQLNVRSRPGLFFDSVRKKTAGVPCFPVCRVYGDDHEEIQDDGARFSNIITWFEKHPDSYVPVVMDDGLVHNIRGRLYAPTSFLSIWKYLHCCNITQLKLNKDEKTVSLDCLTYGERYHVRNLDVAAFRQGFLGGIFITPDPAPVPALAPAERLPAWL